MNTNHQTLIATRLETPAVSAVPYRWVVENEVEQLKNRLLRGELQAAAGLDQNVLLRRAANEAAALAWLTPFPLLVLPVLFDEKARAARRKAERQARIRRETVGFLTLTE